MVIFLVKLWCIFLDVLPSSEKTEFLSNGKNVLMKTLTKASEDPVFNLPIDREKRPRNKAASLATELGEKRNGKPT